MDCPVCLNKKSSRFLIELECHHKLCLSCAQSWLIKHPTCPCCRARTFYFMKSTRSLYHAHVTIRQADYLWNDMMQTYQGYVPINMFMNFIDTFFNSEENRTVWYRAPLIEYKKNFKLICLNHVNILTLDERNQHIYFTFMKSFP